MNKKNDGGPAFPCQEMQQNPGMSELQWGISKREYFAAKAMQTLLNLFPQTNIQAIVQLSYEVADAMLEEGVK